MEGEGKGTGERGAERERAGRRKGGAIKGQGLTHLNNVNEVKETADLGHLRYDGIIAGVGQWHPPPHSDRFLGVDVRVPDDDELRVVDPLSTLRNCDLCVRVRLGGHVISVSGVGCGS